MRFRCPNCGGDCFGSSLNRDDDTMTRHCHGPHEQGGCGWSGHQSEDHKCFVRDVGDYLDVLQEIIDAQAEGRSAHALATIAKRALGKEERG